MAKSGAKRPDFSASDMKIRQAKKKSGTPETQNCKNEKDGSAKDCRG